MKLLLDTHIWLWSLMNPSYLSDTVSKELENVSNELWLSPISIWETMILSEKRKILLEPNASEWIYNALKRVSFKEAPITHKVAILSRKVELPHQDPADRFIVATAIVYDMTLITADHRLVNHREFSVLVNE